VRYNVIQWVHRSTRGWSYGASVSDPRTGEIIKGHVTLGSLRVRQDYLIAEGLLSPYETGTEAPPRCARWRSPASASSPPTRSATRSASRTTTTAPGRAHFGDGLPAPARRADARTARIDLSDAYTGYQHFPEGVDEARELERILAEAEQRDVLFLSNQDVGISPRVDQWSNGPNATAELQRMMEVRRFALERFGQSAIKRNRPLATLEEVLVPLYLHHRYQVEACVRALGGVEYGYETNDGTPRGTRPVAAERQRRALTLALGTLTPQFLALPESLRTLIPPRPPGSAPHRELARPDAVLFDPLALGATGIELALALLLDPARCTRLVDQHAADADQPGFEELVDALTAAGWTDAASDPAGDGTSAALRGELRWGVARHLMRLAADEQLAPRLRERAWRALMQIGEADLSGPLLRGTIARFADDPARVLPALETPRIPPGSPIGCGGPDELPAFLAGNRGGR
jgi:hypothetical protein